MARNRDRELEQIDPNQVPSTMEQRQTRLLKHPEGKNGHLKYDSLSLVLNVAGPGETPAVTNDKPIQVFKGKWTGDPDREELIPEKFLNRDQPFVGTCSRKTQDNMGCFSHNGCPYPDNTDQRGRGPGPFNVIIEKDGARTSCPCYHAYHGTRRGLPTAQVHYLYSGHRIDTDGTTIPTSRAKTVKDDFGNPHYENVEMEMEITELGPMYAHHFGKRKQKVKAERPMEGREDSMDPEKAVAVNVNTVPGTLRSAPIARGPNSVKLG